MDKENKVPKSYSLDPRNIEWLSICAMAQSKPTKRMSDSAMLDNILTAMREVTPTGKDVAWVIASRGGKDFKKAVTG